MAKHVYRNQQLVSVGATDGLFLTSNPRRRALILSPPGTGDAFVSFVGPAKTNEGICLWNKQNVVILTEALMGDSIQEEIRCIGSVGGQTVSVIELSEG